MLFTLWGAGISPEPHKPCHFRQLKWFYNSWHIHIATQALQTLQGVRWEGSWMRAVAVLAIWCSFCPALNLNGFGVHDFAANAETHQTCDETSPIDTSPALWLHPATTTYSTCWCALKPSSIKVVWTLMARRRLGLTKFSAVLPWRLRLTHANLEESTSFTPSCRGPSWHLQSWLLKRNGLTTYRNFRALSDTTWMHWMRYQAAQAVIGEEVHHDMSQNDAGFWMLWFDSSGRCYANAMRYLRYLQPPVVFRIFEADAGQVRSLTSQ